MVASSSFSTPYKVKNVSSFNTTLSRSIDKLRKNNFLMRENKGHKRVFYSLSQDKIAEIEEAFTDQELSDEIKKLEHFQKKALLNEIKNLEKIIDFFIKHADNATWWDNLAKLTKEQRNWLLWFLIPEEDRAS
jgi:hypothetical protein